MIDRTVAFLAYFNCTSFSLFSSVCKLFSSLLPLTLHPFRSFLPCSFNDNVVFTTSCNHARWLDSITLLPSLPFAMMKAYD